MLDGKESRNHRTAPVQVLVRLAGESRNGQHPPGAGIARQDDPAVTACR